MLTVGSIVCVFKLHRRRQCCNVTRDNMSELAPPDEAVRNKGKTNERYRTVNGVQPSTCHLSFSCPPLTPAANGQCFAICVHAMLRSTVFKTPIMCAGVHSESDPWSYHLGLNPEIPTEHTKYDISNVSKDSAAQANHVPSTVFHTTPVCCPKQLCHGLTV